MLGLILAQVVVCVGWIQAQVVIFADGCLKDVSVDVEHAYYGDAVV